jgi:hypothetical protein
MDRLLVFRANVGFELADLCRRHPHDVRRLSGAP